MISKFAKKNKFVANRIFTDRVNPTKVFLDSITALPDKPQEIIVYYGKGGIGKSRLLQQLYNDSDRIYAAVEEYAFHNVFLSFNACEITNVIDVMMTLRNNLCGDGGLFDYAVINYWAKAKFTLDEIKYKNATLSRALHKIIDDAAALGNGSMTIPKFVVNEARGLIKDVGIQNENKDEIEEISILTAQEIFVRLPYYLGLCFSAAAKNGSMHIFFFDGYERLMQTDQSVDWFMEFLASCERLRACIASRDRLRWGEADEDWDDVLNQHLLKNLSDEDSRWFLQQVPIEDEDIISKIVFHSKGVPLFLDMSVDLYQDDVNNNRVPDFSKIKHGEKLIDRYMNYLDAGSRYAIKILSVPDCFHTELALHLLRECGVNYNEDQLQELYRKSIILSIDRTMDMWKLDESVRIHLREQIPTKTLSQALCGMLSYIKNKADGKAFLFFTSILNFVKQDPQYILGLNEEIIEQIDYYGNSGFWTELNKILEPCLESEDDNLRAIAVLAKIIYIRRTGSLWEEEAFINSHPIDEQILGKYRFMLSYHKIQCRHLQGYYDEALEKYRQLLEQMNLIKQTIPSHIYNTVCMKYADLLFLKGRFEESLKITEDLLNSPSITLADQIELMRIKGHIFRFQRRYEQAKVIYLTALHFVEKKNLHAYLGKIMTNLAEVEAFVDPRESISWFKKACDINERNGNLIELVKAYSAGAVANACIAKQDPDVENGKKHIYEAISCANQAILLAKQSGYRAGEAFALVGLALANKDYDANEYANALNRLEQLVEELNVYKYLPDLVK